MVLDLFFLILKEYYFLKDKYQKKIRNVKDSRNEREYIRQGHGRQERYPGSQLVLDALPKAGEAEEANRIQDQGK